MTRAVIEDDEFEFNLDGIDLQALSRQMDRCYDYFYSQCMLDSSGNRTNKPRLRPITRKFVSYGDVRKWK